MALLFVFLLSFAALALPPDCFAPSNADQIDAHLAAAETGLQNSDHNAFLEALQETALLLPCLEEPIRLEIAARYHRVDGIRLVIEGNQAAGEAAFLSAKSLAPTYVFPVELFPAQHHIRLTFMNIDATKAKTRAVPKPKTGELLFDGAQPRRPKMRPTLLQFLDSEGSITLTMPLLGPDPLPEYPNFSSRTRNGFLLGAGMSALAAGSLFASAWVIRGQFDEPNEGYNNDDLLNMKTTINTLTVGSGVFATVALGLGTAGVVLSFR